MQNLLSAPNQGVAKATREQLLQLFQQLLALQTLEVTPEALGRRFYRRAWCPRLTLWYLIWQRLAPTHTLQAVVNDARRGGADALRPGGQSLSTQLRSQATAAYAKARGRLPLAWVQACFLRLAQALATEGKMPPPDHLPVRLLDGSTVRLRPLGKLPQTFPPHRTRRKKSYWCVARVVVSFCAETGVAVGALLSSLHVSEQALAVQLLLQAAARALYVGDRNFGVWRVVRASVQAGGHSLVRLTGQRARCLAAGRRLRPGLELAVQWAPSARDQVDEGLRKEAVSGRLVVARVQRRGFRSQLLLLFTTLPAADYALPQLLELYGRRWQVELHFRTLKATLGLAQLEVKSADLAHKEFYAGLMAYNLVRGLLRLAAQAAGGSAATLSFAAARTQLVSVLGTLWLGWMPAQRRGEQLDWLCQEVARARLPRRRQARPPQPRAQWYEPQVFPPMRGTRPQMLQRLKKAQMKS